MVSAGYGRRRRAQFPHSALARQHGALARHSQGHDLSVAVGNGNRRHGSRRPWPLAAPLPPGRPYGRRNDGAVRGVTRTWRYEATYSLKIFIRTQTSALRVQKPKTAAPTKRGSLL